MILIINQHKGEFDQLEKCLENYKSTQVPDSKFFMSLVVDQELTQDEKDIIDRYAIELKDTLLVTYHDINWGLARSRYDAVEAFKLTYPDVHIDYILFGATNTAFKYCLDDNIYNILVNDELNRITLIPCDYLNDPFERDYRILQKNSIPLSTYLTTDNKPDFTLMFPGDLGDLYKRILCYHYDEVYYPEELYMINYFRLKNLSIEFNNLRVLDLSIQLAWYNDTGMSINFNREFVQRNRNGFLSRAYNMLHEFMNGNLSLSHNKLKSLMYDYVTLNGDEKFLKSDMLEELYWWAMRKWKQNRQYEHELNFSEDVTPKSNPT